MTVDFRVRNGAKKAEIANLARATKSLVDLSDHENFDIIKFLETDIYRIIPEFYLFIEEDEFMDGSKAFTTEDSKSIVVSQSVYNDACAGYFYARKILAHEFGHVLLHHDIVGTRKNFSYTNYEKQSKYMAVFEGAEWQAEMFAILLLVPEAAVQHGKLSKKFSQENKISMRMTSYIEAKVSSYKKSAKSFDRASVQGIIKAFKASNSATCQIRSDQTPQLSLF